MIFYIDRTEKCRANTEEDAQEYVEYVKDHQNQGGYIVTSSSVKYKERKMKGQVIDSWYVITITKHYNDEKEPDSVSGVELYDNNKN